jgi:hypothetical protein
MYGNPVGNVNITASGAIFPASTFSPVGQIPAAGVRIFHIHLIFLYKHFLYFHKFG